MAAGAEQAKMLMHVCFHHTNRAIVGVKPSFFGECAKMRLRLSATDTHFRMQILRQLVLSHPVERPTGADSTVLGSVSAVLFGWTLGGKAKDVAAHGSSAAALPGPGLPGECEGRCSRVGPFAAVFRRAGEGRCAAPVCARFPNPGPGARQKGEGRCSRG